MAKDDEKVSTKLAQLQAQRQRAPRKLKPPLPPLPGSIGSWEWVFEGRCQSVWQYRQNPNRGLVLGPWYRFDDWTDGDHEGGANYVGPLDGPAIMGNLVPGMAPSPKRIEAATGRTVTKTPSVTVVTETNKGGRPKSDNALTDAERAKLYRERQKAKQQE